MELLKMNDINELKEKLDEYFSGGTWKDENLFLPQTFGRILAEDILEGQVSLKRGTKIGPEEIAKLASIGKAVPAVYVKPFVTILTVADNLVSLVETPGPGQKRDANSFALSALTEQAGGKVLNLSFLKESGEALSRSLWKAVDHSDIVIMSGGKGSFDMEEAGRVLNSVGKPGLIFGREFSNSGENICAAVYLDETCHCENRIPALVLWLPEDTDAAIRAYRMVVEFVLTEYYFK